MERTNLIIPQERNAALAQNDLLPLTSTAAWRGKREEGSSVSQGIVINYVGLVAAVVAVIISHTILVGIVVFLLQSRRRRRRLYDVQANTAQSVCLLSSHVRDSSHSYLRRQCSQQYGDRAHDRAELALNIETMNRDHNSDIISPLSPRNGAGSQATW